MYVRWGMGVCRNYPVDKMGGSAMKHSRSCLNQMNNTGKCCCGSDAGQHIPEGMPPEEAPIYRFMTKQGKRDSMSFYIDIKQMLHEIEQTKRTELVNTEPLITYPHTGMHRVHHE